MNLNCNGLSNHVEWNRGTITYILVEGIGSSPNPLAHGRTRLHLLAPLFLGHYSPPPQALLVHLPRERIREEAQNEAIKLRQTVPVYELRRSRSRRWTLGKRVFRRSTLSG